MRTCVLCERCFAQRVFVVGESPRERGTLISISVILFSCYVCGRMCVSVLVVVLHRICMTKRSLMSIHCATICRTYLLLSESDVNTRISRSHASHSWNYKPESLQSLSQHNYTCISAHRTGTKTAHEWDILPNTRLLYFVCRFWWCGEK